MHFQASAWNSTSLVVASVRPSHCSLVLIITSQICKAFDCELSSCGVLSKPMFGQVFIVGVHLGGPQSAGTIEPLCKTLLCGSCLSSHSDIFHEKLVCIESERQSTSGRTLWRRPSQDPCCYFVRAGTSCRVFQPLLVTPIQTRR